MITFPIIANTIRNLQFAINKFSQLKPVLGYIGNKKGSLTCTCTCSNHTNINYLTFDYQKVSVIRTSINRTLQLPKLQLQYLNTLITRFSKYLNTLISWSQLFEFLNHLKFDYPNTSITLELQLSEHMDNPIFKLSEHLDYLISIIRTPQLSEDWLSRTRSLFLNFRLSKLLDYPNLSTNQILDYPNTYMYM